MESPKIFVELKKTNQKRKRMEDSDSEPNGLDTEKKLCVYTGSQSPIVSGFYPFCYFSAFLNFRCFIIAFQLDCS